MGFVDDARDPCGCCEVVDVSVVDLVVIDLVPEEVTVAFVVEACAVATSEPGETTSYAVLDLA